MNELIHPTGGQLPGGFLVSESGNILIIRRPVQTCVRNDVQTSGLGQPAKQFRVSPEIVWGAIDQRIGSDRFELLEVRKGYVENRFGIVASGPDLISADEIYEDVFVYQRPAKAAGREGPEHRHDLFWGVRPSRKASPLVGGSADGQF
jgi:hypothetical protein